MTMALVLENPLGGGPREGVAVSAIAFPRGGGVK